MLQSWGTPRRDRPVTARDDAITRLTEAQREALRLVMIGYQSKEIAGKLGIGVDAVNKRLAAARTALGAPTRFAAARWLAEHEAAHGSPPPVPPPASHSLAGQPLAVEPIAPRPDHARQVAIGNLPHDNARTIAHPHAGSHPAVAPDPGAERAVGDVQRTYGDAGPANAGIGTVSDRRQPGLGQWLDDQLARALATPGRVFAATLLIGAAAALARRI